MILDFEFWIGPTALRASQARAEKTEDGRQRGGDFEFLILDFGLALQVRDYYSREGRKGR